jgi:hypothetical protein
METTSVITIETANKMLTLVEPIVLDIQEKWSIVATQLAKLQTIFSPDADGTDFLNGAINDTWRATKSINKRLDELEQLGCSIEDIEKGVVDFPSILDNEKVMLCWKVGEDEILHYHKRGENVRHRLLIRQVLE